MEQDYNDILAVGLQQIRMILIERRMAMAKQNGELNNEQYEVFRQVSDRYWDKWQARVNRLNRRVRKHNR